MVVLSMAGKINPTKKDKTILQRALDEFPVVDDAKLRMSMIALADKWDEYARLLVYETYNDIKLMTLYKNMRDQNIFQHGSQSKARREVIRFPNGYVYEFCRAVLEPMYGKSWEINPKVWRHEIIRPWLLINLK